MRRQIRKELERESRAEAAKYRAQCDANVAAYKAKLDADAATHKAQLDAQAKRERASRDEERERYRLTLDVYRAKGLITPDEYKLIRSCLHPDTLTDQGQRTVTHEKLAAAFRLFNDPRIKVLLVKETAAPKRA